MNQTCETLKVTQVGGFAGNVPLPPLVDLERASLDAAGQQALDEACRKLAAAAASTGEAPALGADLASYRVEMGGRSFTLASSSSGEESVGSADVPAILATLLEATKATS